MKWAKSAVLLVGAMLMAIHAGHAGVVFHETFDGGSQAGGIVFNGEFRPGVIGQGWIATSTDWETKGREYIEYPLPPGFFPAEGTIEFTIKRVSSIGGDNPEDAVFSIVDAAQKTLLKGIIFWETEKDSPLGEGSVLLLSSAGIASKMGGGPWGGDFLNLNRAIRVGDTVHFAITWGKAGSDHKVYVDGKPVNYKKFRLQPDAKADSKVTVGGLLSNAAYLRIGADVMSIGGPDVSWTPMNDAVVDEFKIHDAAVNAYDTTAPEPVARVLAEPGFGGEIKVSWTASASADVDHYEIYRAQEAPPATTGAPLQTTAQLEYTDAGLVSGARYFYRVIAVDKAGNKSAASEAADAVATAGDGPRIASVTVEPADKPLRPGDVLTVTVRGESGGRGLADIQGLLADLVLTEAKGTGKYIGTLSITEAEVADARQTLQVVGKLSDDYGASQQAGPQITIVSAADLNDKTPPAIAEVTHDGFQQTGFSGKLVAGDTLTVTLAGEKGGYATFRLVGVTDPQPMAEMAPGVYKGSYTVGWDDEGEDVAVEATLADFAGNPATAAAEKTVGIDTRVRLVVTARDSLLPADRESKTRITVRAEDANGGDVEGHELALTLSTTSEYTGVVGGGKVEDKFAAKDDVDDIEVKWGGVTDSFGELAATYTAGFAAKTALILAKDLTTGDLGAGWVNTYVASTVAIELLPRAARAAADLAQMTMSITPSWLTADGRSKARVKVWLADLGGTPIAGAVVGFSMEGGNGSVKVLRGVTDAAGLAEAEYRAGTVAGFVAVTAAAEAYQVTKTMQVELRSDAPAKIDLVASAVSLPADGKTSADITAVVSDINDNRNPNVPVMFSVLDGGGSVAPAQENTDDEGVARATYTAGTAPGMAVVEARHTSRAPSDEELRRVYGTVFVPRLYEDQEDDKVKVSKWLVKDGDTVTKDQPLAILDADGVNYTLSSPEAGVFHRVVRHARDPVNLGETIGYVEIDSEVWAEEYGR